MPLFAEGPHSSPIVACGRLTLASFSGQSTTPSALQGTPRTWKRNAPALNASPNQGRITYIASLRPSCPAFSSLTS